VEASTSLVQPGTAVVTKNLRKEKIVVILATHLVQKTKTRAKNTSGVKSDARRKKERGKTK